MKLMSTLPIRAPHVASSWSFPSPWRVISILATVVDVFAEAQRQAAEAQRRYSFMDW
jgi:hypothetical protein